MSSSKTEKRFQAVADLWNPAEAEVPWTDEKGKFGEVGFDIEYKGRLPPIDVDSYVIDEGSFGSVQKVTTAGGKIGVLKQIKRPSDDQHVIDAVREEVANHRRNPHYHIVQAFGSYNVVDRETFCLLLTPKADCNLQQYMERPEKYVGCGAPKIILPQHIGCLASALHRIHQNDSKHLDLKPTNIVLKGNRILITDFGVTRHFLVKSSSSSRVETTKRYKAPELADPKPRSNRSSDIFSLGCIYAEMFACYKNGSTKDMPTFDNDGEQGAYWRHVPELMEFLKGLSDEAPDPWDEEVLNLISQMLEEDRNSRPTAKEVWERTTAYWTPETTTTMYRRVRYCGPCCMPYSHVALNSDKTMASSEILKHNHRGFWPDESRAVEWLQNVLVRSDMIVDIVRTGSQSQQPKAIRKRVVVASPSNRQDVGWDFDHHFTEMSKLDHIHIAKVQKPYMQGDKIWNILSTPPTAVNLRAYMQKLVWKRQENQRSAPLSEDELLSGKILIESFGCLATALRFVHAKGLRHGNIRPENILLYEDRVYLTGFSQRAGVDDFSNFRKTIVLPPDLYHPYEKGSVAYSHEMEDIFMLGCTFLEMYTVFKGYSLTDLAKARGGPTNPVLTYRSTIPKCLAWLKNIKGVGNDSLIDLLGSMINESSKERPSIAEVVQTLRSGFMIVGADTVYFCGSFCRR